MPALESVAGTACAVTEKAVEVTAVAVEKAAEVTSEVVEKTAEVTSETVEKAEEIGKDATSVAEVSKDVLGKTIEKGSSVLNETSEIENIGSHVDTVKSLLGDIKNTTPEQLRAKYYEMNHSGALSENTAETSKPSKIMDGLSLDEKEKIKEETGWSDNIIEYIRSKEEAEIYKNAGLKEAEIGEKTCLIRTDIDWAQKDCMGRTNMERVEQGLSPVNKDEKIIELHHIGQHADSPLAELTPEEHRGKGNDTILHDKTKESEIDRPAFAEERSTHWEKRAIERSI